MGDLTLEPEHCRALIESRLQQALLPLSISVIDESHHHIGHEGAKGGGRHFAVTVVSAKFEGLSLIERHRLVYDALKDLIPRQVHALKINAKTSNE